MRLITYPQLKIEKGIPYTQRWLAELIKQGRFPRPVELPGSRRQAWREEAIDSHIASLPEKAA